MVGLLSMSHPFILITPEKALIPICGGFLTIPFQFYFKVSGRWNSSNAAVISRRCFSFCRFNIKFVLLLTRCLLFWINYLGRNKGTLPPVIIFMPRKSFVIYNL